MLGAHVGSLYRNVVAHTCDLGASGDLAPVRQQPCIMPKSEFKYFAFCRNKSQRFVHTL